VHRAIRSLIRGSKKVSNVHRVEGAKPLPTKVIYPYEEEQLQATGEHLSVTERRADEATRDVVNWLKCEYLMDRVGEKYTGVVTAVTGFGLFVMLDDLYVEGLIHVTSLPKDYYYHEASQHRMIGERTGRVFRLGQKLTVGLVRVNLEERKIDFELIDDANQSADQLDSERNVKKRKGPSKSGSSGNHGGKRDTRGKPANKKRKSGTKKTAKKKAPKAR
jgi:ribonuclease R